MPSAVTDPDPGKLWADINQADAGSVILPLAMAVAALGGSY